jgi:hypothetical protein
MMTTMLAMSECRQYLPPDWSDDEVETSREKLYILAHITVSEYLQQIYQNAQENLYSDKIGV